MTPHDGWEEYRMFVTAEIDRLSAEVSGLREALNESTARLRVDIAGLKAQAGVWGLLAGAIPVAIMLAVQLMKG